MRVVERNRIGRGPQPRLRVHELIRTVPHVAFEVDDLDAALEGQTVIEAGQVLGVHPLPVLVVLWQVDEVEHEFLLAIDAKETVIGGWTTARSSL